MIPPFVAAMGEAFDALPEPIRTLHGDSGPRRWTGRVTVTGARLAGLLGRIGLAPRRMTDVPFSVVIVPWANGERWTRLFDGRPLRSHVFARAGRLMERAGPVTFEMMPESGPEGLDLTVRRFSILTLPFPQALSPRGEVRLRADGGRYLFDVAALARSGGLQLRYAGWLERA